jgi:predicted nucleic acid-binding protein
MIIVDASVLAPSLIDSDPQGTTLRELLESRELAAPEAIDLEIMSIYRKYCRSGKLADTEAEAALTEFSRLHIELFRHQAFRGRIWELRHNVTSYDATYVALAEFLDVPLWTLDQRLANAPGLRCETVVPSV